MEYKLPKVKSYTEDRLVRAIQPLYVPEVFIDELNDKVAEGFALTIQAAIDEGHPYEASQYQDLYRDILHEVAYELLEEKPYEIDDVIDSCHEYSFEEDKNEIIFLNIDGKSIMRP